MNGRVLGGMQFGVLGGGGSHQGQRPACFQVEMVMNPSVGNLDNPSEDSHRNYDHMVVVGKHVTFLLIVV